MKTKINTKLYLIMGVCSIILGTIFFYYTFVVGSNYSYYVALTFFFAGLITVVDSLLIKNANDSRESIDVLFFFKVGGTGLLLATILLLICFQIGGESVVGLFFGGLFSLIISIPIVLCGILRYIASNKFSFFKK